MKLAITDIEVGTRLRDINERVMPGLVASFQSEGQLEPILVRLDGPKPRLVAGAHRVEAAKRCGWTHIIADELPLAGMSPELADCVCGIAECDENMIRAELDAASRVIFIDARLRLTEDRIRIKKLAEEKAAHAEASTREEKNKAKIRLNRAQKASTSKSFANDQSVDRVATETVDAVIRETGLSRGTIKNARSFANEIGHDTLKVLAGTSNGTQAEMQGLIKLKAHDPKAAARVIKHTAKAKEKGAGTKADDARGLGISASAALGAIVKADKGAARATALRTKEGRLALIRESYTKAVDALTYANAAWSKMEDDERSIVPDLRQTFASLRDGLARLDQVKHIAKQKRTGSEHRYVDAKPEGPSKDEVRESLKDKRVRKEIVKKSKAKK